MNTKLKQAIIKQLGVTGNDFIETCKDIHDYGMNNGVPGFIYYADMKEFFINNRELIADYIMEYSERNGYYSGDLIRDLITTMGQKTEYVLESLLIDNDNSIYCQALCWFVVEQLADSEYYEHVFIIQ